MTLVLVTGGAGFIGSHLVEALIGQGYRVRVLDNLVYGRREWVHLQAEFLRGDICDLDTCRRAAEGVSGIFHAAAMSRAGPSLDNIDVCTQANIVGTQNVLIAGRAAGIRKLVYSGSSTYYGNRPPPHREHETPADFLNFYALSKQVGEQYALMFDRVFDTPCLVLRYFNVYGPRQPQVGAYALVLGIFLRRWADGQPLVIHGDGTQRRDFVHVRDVVRANIMAFESDRRGEIFNVGSGTNVSIKELADLISANQVHEARRKGDAEVTLADIGRIRAALGWSPATSFETGLREMMARAKSGEE
jgi:nucleoside-diphosphate-sugar epimerase